MYVCVEVGLCVYFCLCVFVFVFLCNCVKVRQAVGSDVTLNKFIARGNIFDVFSPQIIH